MLIIQQIHSIHRHPGRLPSSHCSQRHPGIGVMAVPGLVERTPLGLAIQLPTRIQWVWSFRNWSWGPQPWKGLASASETIQVFPVALRNIGRSLRYPRNIQKSSRISGIQGPPTDPLASHPECWRISPRTNCSPRRYSVLSSQSGDLM